MDKGASNVEILSECVEGYIQVAEVIIVLKEEEKRRGGSINHIMKPLLPDPRMRREKIKRVRREGGR